MFVTPSPANEAAAFCALNRANPTKFQPGIRVIVVLVGTFPATANQPPAASSTHRAADPATNVRAVRQETVWSAVERLELTGITGIETICHPPPSERVNFADCSALFAVPPRFAART